MDKIKVGILKPGSAPEHLAAEQGDYDARFRSLFGEAEFDFITYDVENGLFPETALAADAWIITGSRHGVYEDHSWLRPLEQLIREIRAAGLPLLGICFGHQIVAQALGGRVERAEAGWIAGPQVYRDADGNEAVINAWHRDQVSVAPADAEVFLSGDGCPIAGLRYSGPILTIQPHPEFSREYFAAFLQMRGALLSARQRDTLDKVSTHLSPDLGFLMPVMREILMR